MERLENRLYTRDEISGITGIDKSSGQFARDVKQKLTQEGYAYEWLKRRGVRILSRTITPQMRLKDLLTRKLGMNPQVNAVDFSWFIVAICVVDGFASMPYRAKEKVMGELCGHSVDDATLRRWAGKLYESENAYRQNKGALWHTYRDEEGRKHQEPADQNSEDYRAYCAERTALLETLRQEDGQDKSAYGQMLGQLYEVYGCYYWCPEIVLNAMGDEIDEIIALVDEITMPRNEER